MVDYWIADNETCLVVRDTFMELFVTMTERYIDGHERSLANHKDVLDKLIPMVEGTAETANNALVLGKMATGMSRVPHVDPRQGIPVKGGNGRIELKRKQP